MIQEKAAPRGEADRPARLSRLVEEVTRRRLAGDLIADEALMVAHPELMPELAAELSELRLVERARGQALGASADSQTGTRMACAATPSATVSSDSFHGYDILGEIHRGGQGVVYQALQKATKRKVALKVMRESPSTTVRDKARFEQEVQILGQLNHPNIVAVHDSGSEAGQCYYVMDYIPGRPLDQFIAAKDRSVEEVLRLFALVCEAVSAAHLRGIIHRDLKPGNILIDENGAPHILDFGLAKVTGSEVTNDSGPRAMTVTGQFVGSLPWASPEQVEGQSAKIDLRTDVYSLGVTLYQALTGRFPYAVSGNVRDVLDNILRVEPTRLVGAVSDRDRPRTKINDEVETIVLKCLAKAPERRYQSAGELARDIRHYLAGEPIEAKRDRTWYLFKKTLRRYKVAAAVAASFVLLVTVSAVALSVMYGIQKQEREHSDEARLKAEAEVLKAGRIQEFLQGMVTGADPNQTRGREVTVRELLDQAAENVGTELSGQPEVEAALRTTIGQMYRSLGLYDNAEAHVRAALAIRQTQSDRTKPDVGYSLKDLGSLMLLKGDSAQAEELLQKALETLRELRGNEHPDIAEVLNDMADAAQVKGDYVKAESLYREGLAMNRRLLGDGHREVAQNLNNLASLLQSKGDYAGAEQLYRESLANTRKLHGAEHSDVAVALGNLGTLLQAKGEYAEAESVLRESGAISQKLLGDEHPSVALAVHNLACLLHTKGDLAAAEPLYRQCLPVLRRRLGERHVNVAKAMNSLAMLLQTKGDLTESETLYRDALSIFRDQDGGENLGAATCLDNLAALLRDRGDYAAAVPLNMEVAALYRKLLGNEHPELATSLNNLAYLFVLQRNFAAAESPARESLAIRRKALPEAHPYIPGNLIMLGLSLVENGNPTEAEPLLREGLDLRRKSLPEGDVGIAQAESVLGQCLAVLERFAEAEPLLAGSYPVIKARWGEDHERTREARQRLIKLYEAWGKPDQAAEYQASEAQPDLRSFRDWR